VQITGPTTSRALASPRSRRLDRSLQRGARKGGFYVILCLVFGLFLLPLFWMVLSAIKPPGLVSAYPPVWIFAPSFDNFVEVLQGQDLLLELLHSALIGIAAVGIGLFLGLPAAYSIARHRQQRLATLLLVTRMVPFFACLIPMYLVFKAVGLTNSLIGIAISHLVITVPLTVWIMIGFFEDVPRELEEAAAIDGASRIGSFWRIGLPLVTPGIVAAAVLNFIFSWNNFQMALVLGGVDTKTAPLAVLAYTGTDSPMDWGGMAASATVVVLPTFFFVLFVQRYLVKGLTMGGLKG